MAHSSTATKSIAKTNAKSSQMDEAPPAFRPVQLAKLVDTVAVSITWKEMETIDTPLHFHIGDAAEFLKGAASKVLAGRGRADRELPDL